MHPQDFCMFSNFRIAQTWRRGGRFNLIYVSKFSITEVEFDLITCRGIGYTTYCILERFQCIWRVERYLIYGLFCFTTLPLVRSVSTHHGSMGSHSSLITIPSCTPCVFQLHLPVSNHHLFPRVLYPPLLCVSLALVPTPLPLPSPLQ